MYPKLGYLTGGLFVLSGVLILAGVPDPALMEAYGSSLVTTAIGPFLAGGLIIAVSTILRKARPGVWDFLLLAAALILISVSAGVINCGGGEC